MNPIKILIADDHKMFRDGIKALLKLDKAIVVMDDAENGQEVLDKLDKQEVNVLLTDISMPVMNGIEVTKKIKSKFPEVKVLALTMHDDEEYIVDMLEAGCAGYILKNTGREELVTAIKTVASGDSYLSKAASDKLIAHLNKERIRPKQRNSDIPITDRELQVLKLVVEEYGNQEIADKLHISHRTVDTHKRNLLQKLHVKNIAGLVKYAINKGLVKTQGTTQ